MLVRNLFLVIFIFISTYTVAGQEICLTDGMSSEIIGRKISILNQDSSSSSFLQVSHSQNFLPNNQEVPNLGIVKNDVWLKFKVKNCSKSTHYLLDVAYPILDVIELYEVDSNFRNTSQTSMGESHSFYSRIYNHPTFIFDLDIEIGATKTYFLKVKSAEQIILPITISKPSSLWQNLAQENTISGIYLGIILIMIFYNLFLFFSVRDKGYLYYVFYVVFVGLAQLGIKGFTFQYLWPNSTGFEAKSVIIFACISSNAALLFTEYFLKLKINAPRLNLLLNALHTLFLISLGLTLLGHIQSGFQMMLFTTSIGSVIVISISIFVVYKGYRPAKYFLAAWSVLLFGSILFLLKDYGILPYNLYTSYSFQAASAIEMALLSFGLANRINILKKEKEQSQLEALNSARENERIIKEQNTILEQKVEERTHELKETNEDLNQTLENLKQAQSQLVESEKMASLGQLTAGIAHEINNPINFVTSNVTPLKRDVGMVFDTIEFVESIGLSQELSLDEKKNKIANYKDELDYDYLKIEINHLLNGIYEGSSRTAEIVKGLRIFSRVDENDLKLANINEGLDSTLIIVNNLLNGEIQINKNYSENLPMIECYPGKLNQVFLNIISNAIHAVKLKHHDKQGAISITTQAFDDYITVEFADNGVGMDEVTISKIFEPFFTTKDVGEGTGLGMSIAYNTVKKHNGTIKVNSKIGEGTAFLIKLPIIFEM